MRFSTGFGTGAALLLAAGLLVAGHAQAQQYPVKPVRIVIPFPSGGGADQASRLVAGHLMQSLGQPFVVEARPGGNTIIAADAVAKSAADGYTLLVCAASTVAVNPSLFSKLPYDPPRDFVPVGRISKFPFFVVVPIESSVKTIQELLAAAKAKPGQVSYASVGNGTASHLGFELLRRSAGVELLHVPYKSYGGALPDLLTGRLQVMMADLAVIGSTIRAGKLRVLGATSEVRSAFMPEVPTVAEQGVPGFDLIVWFAMFAPAGTPAEVVNRLSGSMMQYLATPETAEAYRRIGHEAAPTTPAELGTLVRTEAEKWGKVVRDAGIKAD